MCDTTTGEHLGWAVGVADCDSDITIEYFDVDGVSEGNTLPAGWKPCVQGVAGQDAAPLTIETITEGATIDIDLDGADIQVLDVTDDFAMDILTYGDFPRKIEILVNSDSSSHAMSFNSDWNWIGGVESAFTPSGYFKIILITTGPLSTDVVAEMRGT